MKKATKKKPIQDAITLKGFVDSMGKEDTDKGKVEYLREFMTLDRRFPTARIMAMNKNSPDIMFLLEFPYDGRKEYTLLIVDNARFQFTVADSAVGLHDILMKMIEPLRKKMLVKSILE